MTNLNLNLSKAIQLAMETEKSASEFYADAATKIGPIGKKLFEELAEFELHHYKKLATLRKALIDEGVFIKYDGKNLPVPDQPRKEKVSEDEKLSMMNIITMAIDAEKRAEDSYIDMAEQTEDPDGKEMFHMLANEENQHYRILRGVYWNLNQTGEWKYP